MSPRPAGSTGPLAFDRVATTYDETRGGLERGRQMAAVLAGLLEVGVGTGVVAAGLAEHGRTPVGVDLSLPMLAVARPRLPGRLAAGDGRRLPVRTGSVAGAYLVHVLHLVGDIPATLAEVARVLRPGGTLVATAFPAGGPGRADLHEELARIRSDLDAHERPDDPALVIALAGAAGFVLEDRRDEPGRTLTPRQAIETMETRSMSWMWTVDDPRWTRELPRALDRLRALPDQDEARSGPGPTILAFSHP